MTTIKLRHDIVNKSLNNVMRELDTLELAKLGFLGKNKSSFTTKYHSREKAIHKMIGEYKKAVEKNVKDVKGNVDLLKEQDKAIARK
ncbi:YwqI/YxiC family protein [Bacillus sp. WMMC1349]|uniref:DUF5344 family protein n=1 Tax=Bacillus sp. WMMC1349 TaxID=2736254 RepID=UPI001554D88A|nr:DUF5344 family protein [Bacillus sp. WMMC1349]NPC93628.1 YwqI/YxiC family protein [Bacillus sp. WMMC1349]